MIDVNEDVIVACADLAGRAGARGFEIGYLRDDVPTEDAGWYAVATYRGARLMTDEHRSPSAAALALAERILAGATCRCGEPVTLSDGGAGCRWRLTGRRWEPGCDAAPIPVPGDDRGDIAAITAAAAAAREERRQSRRQPRRSSRRERRR